MTDGRKSDPPTAGTNSAFIPLKIKARTLPQEFFLEIVPHEGRNLNQCLHDRVLAVVLKVLMVLKAGTHVTILMTVIVIALCVWTSCNSSNCSNDCNGCESCSRCNGSKNCNVLRIVTALRAVTDVRVLTAVTDNESNSSNNCNSSTAETANNTLTVTTVTAQTAVAALRVVTL